MKQVGMITAVMLLASCAADGSWAGKSKPVDRQVTLDATCRGLEHADRAFQALVTAKPGLVDENGLAVERAIMVSIQPICAQPYTGDLDVALNVTVAALVQLSTLMANWQASP